MSAQEHTEQVYPDEPECDEPAAPRQPLLGAWRALRWHTGNLAAAPALGLRPRRQLSEHFHANEFACNHCGRLAPGGVPALLVQILERVRGHFGRPVRVTSGYRCPTHNRNVGGATRSQHLRGTAADIQVDGVAAHKVHAYLASFRGRKGGLGRYRRFTHVDVGPNGRRW